MLTDVLSGFANISLAQLAIVACVTLVASVVGGVAGYGTGALMPLVLVPMLGAEPVVPIIAISALFTNLGRVAAFLRHVDGKRAADHHRLRRAHLRARRLGLLTAVRRRRGIRDRRDADPERAAAPHCAQARTDASATAVLRSAPSASVL